jgi:hypothetical protein
MADSTLYGKCGLYCGICSDYLNKKECLGCGCTCEQCAAHWHHQACRIYHCAEGKGLTTCAECPELPCTMLIQFNYDPKWRTHLPVIENCRRIRRIGLAAWLDEQETFWQDEKARQRWITLHERCGQSE